MRAFRTALTVAIAATAMPLMAGTAAQAATPPPVLSLTGIGCIGDINGFFALLNLTDTPATPPQGVTVAVTTGSEYLLPSNRISVDNGTVQRVVNVPTSPNRSGNARLTFTATDRNGATSAVSTTVRMGTMGNDVMTGTGGKDWFIPRAGKAKIKGLGGDDLVCGENYGVGTILTVDGGAGNDHIDGAAGSDTLNGGDGNDYVVGGFGDDAINGNAGNDTLMGVSGADTFTGGPGNDKVLDFASSEGDVKVDVFP